MYLPLRSSLHDPWHEKSEGCGLVMYMYTLVSDLISKDQLGPTSSGAQPFYSSL